MQRSLINYFTVELQSRKVKVMCSQMQWWITFMSWPFIQLESCSMRTKLIHPLLAVFVSTLVNIQTGISSGNLLFKLLGWNLFTVWWMPDGIKTFSTHFINGKRVDHYNLYLGLKAQSMRVSCFLQHFQHQQHESLSSLTSRSSMLLDLIVTSFHSYRVNASNHLSIEIHKTFFFFHLDTTSHCRVSGYTHTADRHTAVAPFRIWPQHPVQC